MPELPEVETVRRELRALEGAECVSMRFARKDLRMLMNTHDAPLWQGATLARITRRGKYLVFHGQKADGRRTYALSHLGMSGSWRFQTEPDLPPKKHDHIAITWQMGTARHTIIYNDPRRFGVFLILPKPRHALLDTLGMEPLSARFDGAWLYALTQRHHVAIKTLIMNARKIVGVGNIYVAEALFIAGILPFRAANTLTATECDRLAGAIKKVLRHAIRVGGSTIRDYVRPKGDSGYFQMTWQVYGRAGEACYTCQTPIQNTTLQGRSTYYCPRCQV